MERLTAANTNMALENPANIGLGFRILVDLRVSFTGDVDVLIDENDSLSMVSHA